MKHRLTLVTIALAALLPLIVVPSTFADPAPAGTRVPLAGLPPFDPAPLAAGLPAHAADREPRRLDASNPCGTVSAAGLPDLTVLRELPDAQGRERFTVLNQGSGHAGPFRIAVLAGAQSFPIETRLCAGERMTFAIPGLECGQAVGVIADIRAQVRESDEGNNSINFFAGC
jgi:hypothetical protein